MTTRPLAVAVSGRGLVDPAEPVLAADDEGFLRGHAAFETLRVYGGRPFRLTQHLGRLERSAASLGLPAPDSAEVERLAGLALERAGAPDSVLRLYWTPGPAGAEEPLALALVSTVPGWIDDQPRARARAGVASVPAPFGPLAARRDKIHELRGSSGGGGRGQKARCR